MCVITRLRLLLFGNDGIGSRTKSRGNETSQPHIVDGKPGIDKPLQMLWVIVIMFLSMEWRLSNPPELGEKLGVTCE